MITESKKTNAYQVIITVLLAFFPALYLLAKYPPFFNSMDSMAYFNFEQAIPQYPLLYPLFCTGIFRVLGGTISAIYLILIIQHIFYSLSVLYIAFYFKETKARYIFLAIMVFAFRATVLVHGIYTEALAIIAGGFIMGALLRICLWDDSRSKRIHYFVFALAFIILLLTRFAGAFLLLLLPVYSILIYRKAGILWQVASLKTVFKQLLLILFIVAAAQAINTLTLIHYKKPDFSLYGRPGTYRIADALNPKCTFSDTQKVLEKYKSLSSDTVTKCAFDILAKRNISLWGDAYTKLDSVKNIFVQKGVVTDSVTTDAYLNSAFKIYVSHPVSYPWFFVIQDILWLWANPVYIDDVTDFTDLFVSRDYLTLNNDWAQLSQYVGHNIKSSYYHNGWKDPLVHGADFFTTSFLMIIALAVIRRKRTMPDNLKCFYQAVIINVFICHVLMSIITAYLARYSQPAEFMLYITICFCIATIYSTSSKKELSN